MALDTRAVAAQILGEVLCGRSLNQALPPRLARVERRDRGLLQQLCYGSLRDAPRLRAILNQLLDKPLRQKDSDILGLLLCGLYQLESTRIPDHAAVSATVNAAGALKKPWARNMANAIMRRYLRERDDLQAALDEAAAASHPEWLYRKLLRQWPEEAAGIIEANNLQPPMTLRVNSRRLGREACMAKLAAHNIAATPGELSPQAIRLEQAMEVADLPGFCAGDLSVQDEAAQLAAPLLGAGPGERVLDACAAPGGKACHILELQPELGELVAMDVDEERLQKVAENLRRLDLAATLLAADASTPGRQLAAGSFDRILVDAPCSATGVIRRHPDVKLLRREEDIGQLAGRQLGILQGLWPLLRPGGTLLYVTCSVLAEENAQVVERFLAGQPGASAAPLNVTWGRPAGRGRQVLPRAQGTDGLYFALLTRSDHP